MRRRTDSIDEQIQKLLDKKSDILSKTLVKCESNVYGKGCGKKTQIKNLTFIQTHWYEEPWGCNGGADWNPGEGQFICPKCGHKNRLYDRPRIQDLKYSFGKIENQYD